MMVRRGTIIVNYCSIQDLTGALGCTVRASKSYFGEPVCETIVAGDISGDCKINFLDFRLMALQWLRDENK